MRILQVCPYDWHAPGGVQTHVRRLTLALQARGHDVLTLAPGYRRADEPWVRVIGRPWPVNFNGSRAPICPRLSAASVVRRVMTDYAPDVVHAHEPISPSLGMFAALSSPVPVVATFHAQCETRLGRLCYSVATRPFNRHLTEGIAVSRAALRTLRPGVLVPIQIIPNGVDEEFLMLTPRPVARPPRRLLFAHRLEPRKGLRVALDALPRLVARYPDLVLDVVGDGAESRRLRALPDELAHHVRVHGTLARERLVAAFGNADVFLAPALGAESFGMALLEAMAAGLPVVASAIPGYAEVVRHGLDGVLVPPDDAGALASALDGVLRDPVAARVMGESGRQRAATFTWGRIAEDVEKVLDRARSRTHPRQGHTRESMSAPARGFGCRPQSRRDVPDSSPSRRSPAPFRHRC
jgi:phosphatidylinositol alpha-mannosyltransferase